jgi:type IV pilus assembly protein PilO
MADFSHARKKIMSAIVVLGIVDAAALVYLVLPLRAGAAQPSQVQRQAEEDYRTTSHTALPLRGIDHKLAQAQKDDAAFIQNRLPSRYSDVVSELGKVASQNHVRISAVSYKTNPGRVEGVQDLEMHAGLSGSYVNVVRFMNSLERDRMFFIIDSIGLTSEKTHNGPSGEVQLDMKLDTYLRTQS